jgi:transmembrane sensor
MGSMMRRDEIREIEAAAARWIVRLRDEPVSRQTEIEFDRWLSQSAEHRSCYMRCEIAMAMTNALQDDPAFKADFEECARIAAAEREEATRRRFGKVRQLWTGLAAVAAAAALVIGVRLFPDAPSPENYRTTVGEQKTVLLADRSELTLNTDTSLSVLLTKDMRRIELHHGEAFFSVAHDPSRAFEVWAAGGKVRAVGTQFGVTIDRDQVTVAVLEGAVEVSPAVSRNDRQSAVPRLGANQSVRYRAGGEVSAVEAADVRRINGWLEGKLVFDGMPLAAAIADFNRYTDRKVVLGTVDIGLQQVSGSLPIGDDDSLAFLLRESLGLRIVEQGGTVLVLPAEAEETGTRD